MIRVVLDTNILVSVFLWSKRVKQAISPLINEKKIEVVFSEETLDELNKVLLYKKFVNKFALIDITPQDLVNNFLSNDNVVVVGSVSQVSKKTLVEKDPSDDKFLYLAESVKAKYIVSGDKILLSLKEFKGVKIVSIQKFLQILKS